MSTKVINRARRPSVTFDIYIGRPGPWGNPFHIGPDGDRQKVIEAYRVWIQEPEQASLLSLARRELRGKVLGCWCKPMACHGDVLIELIQ